MVSLVRSIKVSTLSALVIIAGLVCTSAAADKGKADEKGGHSNKGPHKGVLVELGEEEYHAEIVHNDEKQTITVYILDSSAKKAVSIEGKEIVIDIKHGKEVEQFRLASSPDQADAKGTSSRFMAKNKELCEDLDKEGVEARLSLKIKGKAYNAKLAHDHDEKK